MRRPAASEVARGTEAPRPRPEVAEADVPDPTDRPRSGRDSRGDESPRWETGAALPSDLEAALLDLEEEGRFGRALELANRLLAQRPADVGLLARKLRYAFLAGDEAAVVSAYLNLGDSLDGHLEGFHLRALSSVSAAGEVTAAVRVTDIPGRAGS